MAKFTPPIESKLGPYHDTGEFMDRVCLEITDSLGQRFALTVETQESFEDRIAREAMEGIESDGTEPVYLWPLHEIVPSVLEQVLQIPPELLEQYLVEQEPYQPIPDAA